MNPELRDRLQLAGMNEWYDAADGPSRSALGGDLDRTLTRLLGLPPGASGPTEQAAPRRYEELLDQLVQRTGARLALPAYPHDRALARELIRRMANLREPEARLPSLVHDLAELLALPRAARSEYQQHRDPPGPWRIRKLLLEYAVKAQAIDQVVAALNKGFCATACPDPPVGCCHILGYDLGLVPEAMLELQGLEAAWQASARPGWEPLPPGAVERKCRYHTATGCVLVRWKSPACIGTLCAALLAHLPTRYPPEIWNPLHDALDRFRRCDLDRSEVFDAMDGVLAAGAPLRAPAPSPTPRPGHSHRV